MAGKPKRMSQIKQLLKLHAQGKGKKTIARLLGLSKNTVKMYLSKLESGSMDIAGLLALDDPVLESVFFSGSPSYKQERYEYLKGKFEYYACELKKPGVTRGLLWQEYKDGVEEGKSYGYTQFCHHLGMYLKTQKPTMVLEHRAGEKLYIDFAGKTLEYVDKETGEIIKCQVFVACLPYSDYSFALAVRTQGIEDFIYALACCLKEFCGVPQALVTDNLKAAIVKAHRYEPQVNRVLEDFANHYGCAVVPARVRKPRDKALVENQVKLLYSRVYARIRNRTFLDLDSLNTAIREKIKAHNQTRMQQKDYCREEKFLSHEKHTLSPLPRAEFEIKYYKDFKVAQNNHVYLGSDKHYYSVPYSYIGQQVKLIYTRSMVHIYHANKQIALHTRSYNPGGYSTQKEHLCSHHQHYLERSPQYYLNRAKSKSTQFYRLIDKVFTQDRYPEQLYRTCDGLLSLQRKIDAQIFDKACSIALQHHNYSYKFIENLIKNKMTHNQDNSTPKLLPSHSNTRGAGYYK